MFFFFVKSGRGRSSHRMSKLMFAWDFSLSLNVIFVAVGSQIKEESAEGTELSSERTKTETNGSSGEFFTKQDH